MLCAGKRPAGTLGHRRMGQGNVLQGGIVDKGFKKGLGRRCPTLPRSFPRSTIGAEELNDRVRDGNGCGLLANTTPPKRGSSE